MSLYEAGAAFVSAWAVWLTARRQPWCYPIGLVSVLAYAWIFTDSKLYSDAALQIVFALLLVYGWHRWLHNLDDDGLVRIAPLSRGDATMHLAVGILAALVLGFVMHRWTDASLPWLDAALAAFSLVAQWWQARRHVAAWWLWIAVDVVYVGEYLYKSLFITSILYAAFVVLAVIGLRTWRRERRVGQSVVAQT
ncbi:nicotinamide riboside transporter PnuC [Luteibacter rhizovicinus]|nr:nicotinamide riboside transporter PnuC [Luteibacter rhizovicinus]